jgi:hypothetical protein
MNVFNAANVIARALIPIVGIWFLDWSGTALLVVYFADTLASLYACAVVAGYATLLRGAEYQAWVKDGLTFGKRLRTWFGVFALPIPFLAVVGFFFGVLPLFVMVDIQAVPWSTFLYDRNLWIGVACQFFGAFLLLTRLLAKVGPAADPSQYVKTMMLPLAVRWGALVLVGFFLSPYIPRVIYGALLIVTYAVATVALELAPQRVMALLAKLDDSLHKP